MAHGGADASELKSCHASSIVFDAAPMAPSTKADEPLKIGIYHDTTGATPTRVDPVALEQYGSPQTIFDKDVKRGKLPISTTYSYSPPTPRR
jgi:hypothetical protein